MLFRTKVKFLALVVFSALIGCSGTNPGDLVTVIAPAHNSTPTPTRAPTPAPNSTPTPTRAPVPVPTLSTGACSSQPSLHQSQIPSGPFSGCGFADRLQSPSPTEIRHLLGHGSGRPITDGWESCILPMTYARWAFADGIVNVTTSNQVYHNRSRIPGNLVFSGHDVIWRNVQEGSIAGSVVCNNCRNIEVDGVCYGPTQ